MLLFPALPRAQSSGTGIGDVRVGVGDGARLAALISGTVTLASLAPGVLAFPTAGMAGRWPPWLKHREFP